ncbi:hypothetical protein V6N13_135977 [Hibiscus sabdariffa]|uniref:Uncharacterized protein n=2 Tax=Hibiscus sabdariffa TaxID=183260 RepID=A0ABR2QTB5_9ROSI
MSSPVRHQCLPMRRSTLCRPRLVNLGNGTCLLHHLSNHPLYFPYIVARLAGKRKFQWLHLWVELHFCSVASPSVELHFCSVASLSG